MTTTSQPLSEKPDETKQKTQLYGLTPTRVMIGWGAIAFLVLIGAILWNYYRTTNVAVANALLGGGLAALATALGTVPVLMAKTLSERTQDAMMGFGAGVMLAACSFSLIIPGIETAETIGFSTKIAALIVGGSIFLGAGLMVVLENISPHEHFITDFDAQRKRTSRRTWLFIFAIALHNVPEGFAIGVAFGGLNQMQAFALAVGIAVQDIPEGLVVAVALLAAGYKKQQAVLIGVASGIVEPIAALAGVLIIDLSNLLLPWGFGFAAGAMLFVISHELIPESHRKGHESAATGGLIIGFIIMMFLDVTLG